MITTGEKGCYKVNTSHIENANIARNTIIMLRTSPHESILNCSMVSRSAWCVEQLLSDRGLENCLEISLLFDIVSFAVYYYYILLLPHTAKM